jgi:hypothetical protein
MRLRPAALWKDHEEQTVDVKVGPRAAVPAALKLLQPKEDWR